MNLLGIRYEINLKQFRRGYSFFIPCLDHAKTKIEIRNFLRTRGIKNYKMKVSIEDNTKGIRVWKL